jgi:anti-sigma B factor antagonist
MAELFGVERRSSGRTITLSCWGEIDASACPRLRSHIDDALQDHRATHLVLDLSRTTFCDTTALSVLLAADRLTRTSMTPLRILRPVDPEAYRVFEVTGLDALLPFAEPPLAEAAGEAVSA